MAQPRRMELVEAPLTLLGRGSSNPHRVISFSPRLVGGKFAGLASEAASPCLFPSTNGRVLLLKGRYSEYPI